MRPARITPAALVIGLAAFALCDSTFGQIRRPTEVDRRPDVRPVARPVLNPPLGFIPVEIAQELHYPNVVGTWTGTDWGRVELRAVENGVVEGTYSDTFGTATGEIKLKFNERSRRFDGIWREGKYRHGRISIRLGIDRKSVRGAWTTDESCEHDPGFPALSDLEWAAVIPEPDKNDKKPAKKDAPKQPPVRLNAR